MFVNAPPIPTSGCQDLRRRLLADLHNVELRQAYLAHRTTAWIEADRQRAFRCLLVARWLRIVAGFALLGLIGTASGQALLGGDGSRSYPILAGIGSSLVVACVFALLAAGGHVVFPELVGEVTASPPETSEGSWLGRLWDRAVEIACGTFWGALCGLLIGPAVGLVQVCGVRQEYALLAGSAGGALTGVGFAVLVTLLGRASARRLACWWAELGPLGVSAYLFSEQAARRYLRK